MPSQLELPDGAHRKLVATLHTYYRQAGSPTLQAIDDWIDRQDGITASKETVRRMLVGISVPLEWDIAKTVFLALCALAGRNPDEYCDGGRTALRDAYHQQWHAVIASRGRVR